MRFFENQSGDLRRYSDIFNIVPIDNPLYLAFCVLSTCGILVWLQRGIVRREKLRIQFFITDFWAAVIALVPSFLLLADLDDASEDLKARQIGLFMLAFFSTLAGVRAWLILSCPKSDEPLPGRWSHFVSVLSGGIVGFLGVFVSVLAFAAVAFLCAYVPTLIYYALYSWIGLIFVMPPLAVVSVICLYIIKKSFEDLKR